MTEEERRLNELANDVFATLFARPKPKRLRPLVKQMTYKGKKVKWTFNGAELHIVNGPTIDWLFANENGEYESVEDYIKRRIDRGGL